MNTNSVRGLPVHKRFLYWIEEREHIREERAAGHNPPWTDDEILQTYKFCNVRRMDDYVSRWLLYNWYEPYYNHKNMVLACVLARHFNEPNVLGLIGFPEKWQPTRWLRTIQRFRETGGKPFRSAYIIRACKEYPDKAWMVIDQTCRTFRQFPLKVDRSSLRVTTERLLEYHNIGSFMAGQIACDLRWAMQGDWDDVYAWAAVGPGSRRGVNRLLEEEVKSPMSQEEFLEHLTDISQLVRDNLPEIYSRLEAIDIQNCLCEFDKYERALWGEGKPKCLYRA